MNKLNIIERIGWQRLLPVVLALVVLLVMTFIFANDWKSLSFRDEDMPPVIEFTWTPLGEVDLKEFRGFLKMTDDYSLDFTTYQMQIAEMDKTYDLPIDGLLGREYESPIFLSLLANNPKLLGKRQITIKFTISDDKGQESVLERVIKIKPLSQDSAILQADGFKSPIQILN